MERIIGRVSKRFIKQSLFRYKSKENIEFYLVFNYEMYGIQCFIFKIDEITFKCIVFY